MESRRTPLVLSSERDVEKLVWFPLSLPFLSLTESHYTDQVDSKPTTSCLSLQRAGIIDTNRHSLLSLASTTLFLWLQLCVNLPKRRDPLSRMFKDTFKKQNLSFL